MAKNNFTLTLDTLAPEGSIVRPAEFMKANQNLTITTGQATYMKVWFDTKKVGDVADSGEWEVATTSKQTNFTSNGQYYYHLVLMDDVGNQSEVYDTDLITFDSQPPVVSDVVLSDRDSASTEYTNELVVNYSFAHSDNLSGCASAVISGEALASSVSVSLAGDGTATGSLTFKEGTTGSTSVSVVVTDRAGNVSSAGTASIYVDTGVSPLTVLLRTSAGEQLPGHINYRDIIAHLKSVDTDIVGYKVWEKSSAEPASYTAITPDGALELDVPVTLSEGDGTKVICAKVVDRAGTATDVVEVSVVYDITDPAVTLACDRTIISNVDTFNKATLTITATDATAGIASYTLAVGGTNIENGNDAVPGSFEITSASSLVEGTNTITLTVVDKAGNSTSKSVDLILDTTAPVVTAPTLETWYNEAFNITVGYTDDNNLTTIYAWSDNLATNTTIPNTTAVNATGSGQVIAANNIGFNFVQSADNYLHIAVKDEVGNIGYTHAKFGYDNVAPTGTIKFEKSVYGTVSAKVTITYEDAVSKVAKMALRGDITDATAEGEWEAIASSRTVELAGADGMKSVEVRFLDNAGNISDWIVVTAECELDRSKPTATIQLYKSDNETTKPNVSALADTTVRISYSDTDTIGGVEYKLYGDFTGASEDWVAFKADEGKPYMSIPVTAIAPADNKKVERSFHVVIRDNAGNESPVASASFFLDPTAPEAVVEGVDFNIISKVNVLRRNAEGEIAGKYADEVHFTIVPSEVIIAWKVCAYATEAAALAGEPTDAAIPMTNGSVHMSGSTNTAASIDCMIKGADYEAALGGSDENKVDGAHIVVVYVQNEAGLWSAKYINN